MRRSAVLAVLLGALADDAAAIAKARALVVDPDERLAAAMIVNSDESFTRQTPRIAEAFLDGD